MPINYSKNNPKKPPKPGTKRKVLRRTNVEPGESDYRRGMTRAKREENRKSTHPRGAVAQARAARLVIEKEDRTHKGRMERKRRIAHELKPLYCGAKKRNGEGRCKLAAGFGTNHRGHGACKFHGGAMPNHQRAADKANAVSSATLMGAPKEINPLDAIIWCIQIKAGEVEWLSMKIAQLSEKEWVEQSIAGRRFNILVRQRDEATKALVEFSHIAIRLGLAERAVKLAEQYGEMLATLIRGILDDLDLDVNQRAAAPAIIRRHLILVQSGIGKELPEVIDGEAKEVA